MVFLVHCCASDRTWPYMYEPVVSTLHQGVKATFPTWKIENTLLPNVTAASDPLLFAHLRHPDVMICIGPLACPLVPWEGLRRRRVLTVYYQTEPLHECTHLSADEVWDFSWHNIEMCEQDGKQCRKFDSFTECDGDSHCTLCSPTVDKLPRGPTFSWNSEHQVACVSIAASRNRCQRRVLRYVPLGALPMRFATQHRSHLNTIAFLGNPHYRRQECWDGLRKQLSPNDRLIFINNVWSDQAYEEILHHQEVFVNVHTSMNKGSQNWSPFCGDSHNPVTFRFAKLLNSRALIISEHCHVRDEEEFQGTVTFVNFSALGSAFRHLRQQTKVERQLLAEERYRLFQRRFAPEDVFRRSGITRSLSERVAQSRMQLSAAHSNGRYTRGRRVRESRWRFRRGS